VTDALAKKRLGQYFSGKKVADLLVAICVPTFDTSVIDPMAGNGDMLVAAINLRDLAVSSTVSACER
jgi:type I restriction-modification system DNA methylase subunit